VPASRIIRLISLALLALCISACRDDAGYPAGWPALSSKSWVGGLGTGCPNLSGSFSLQDASLYQWLFEEKLERFRFAHQVMVLPSVHANAVQFEFVPSAAGLQEIQQIAKKEGNLSEFPWRELARLEETDFRCEHGFLILTRTQRFQLALSRSVDGDLVIRIDAPKDMRTVLRQSEGFALDDLRERHWIQFERAEAAPEANAELTYVASDEQSFAWNFASENICVVRADSAPQTASRRCEAPGKILSFTQKIELDEPENQAGKMPLWYWPMSEPSRVRRLNQSALP
jgi:hypothetical protein